VATTPTSTPQNNKKTLPTTSSPASKIRLFNRSSPNSPLAAAVRSAPRSPLVSPYTEPRLRVRSLAGSPNNSSAIGVGVLTALTEAAMSDDVDAQFNLAMSYSFGKGVDQNFEKALSWFLKCAQQGDAKAQYYVGVMYSNGHGIPVDLEKAAEWYIKSANQGDAAAQCDLGIMYLHGHGVEKNETVAVAYVKSAAEQGHADAQLNLAVSYESGEGIDKDMTLASLWYGKAAEQGDIDAQIQLERLFMQGPCTDKEKTDILHWYQQAAAKNLKFAQKALVNAYSLGLGVSQDLKLATYWSMRSDLENGISIRVAEENFDLIQYMPGIVKEFPEFRNLRKLQFQEGYVSNENFSAIAAIIRESQSLELLDLTGITMENSDGLVIIESLKENTSLTDIFLDTDNVNPNILSEIKNFLEQNIAIADAKKYAQNHMIFRSNVLSANTITTQLEKLIIFSIKSGQSLGSTKHAIDEFLANSISKSLGNSSQHSS
jgi:TPR repeat protein